MYKLKTSCVNITLLINISLEIIYTFKMKSHNPLVEGLRKRFGPFDLGKEVKILNKLREYKP